MRWMAASYRFKFFLPRFLRSGLNHSEASMSCARPLRFAGLRLVSTQM